MIDLSDKSVVVMDYKNNISVAQRLAKSFGTVYYWGGPYVSNGFPEQSSASVGLGVSNIIKVKEWAEVYDQADMFMFTDSMEPFLQDKIRSWGKPVFGSVFADRLEHDRVLLNETLKSLGLPVGLYSIAKGLDELEEILKNAGGVCYVKAALRGSSETWRHTDWRLSKRQLKKLRYEMGVYENVETYVISQHMDCIVEWGYDGFFDGKNYVPVSMCGIEKKDKCYLGKFIRYQLLPESIRLVNDAMAPIFSEMGYQGHYSNEMLFSKDKRSFLIDNTNRFPSPPGELMLEAYTNYPEIVWLIANGEMPPIEYHHEWGAQLIIKSDIAEEDPSPIIVPEEYKQFVKIKNLSIEEDGTWNFIPSPGLHMKEIGSIVFTADSEYDVIKGIREIAESIEGFDIHIDTESLDDAKKSLEKLRKAGILFI